MTPVAQSAGVMTALNDMGNFIFGTIENHASLFLGLLALSIVSGLLIRKMSGR